MRGEGGHRHRTNLRYELRNQLGQLIHECSDSLGRIVSIGYCSPKCEGGRMWVKIKLVQQEVVRMHSLDVVLVQRLLRKMSQIESDYHFGVPTTAAARTCRSLSSQAICGMTDSYPLTLASGKCARIMLTRLAALPAVIDGTFATRLRSSSSAPTTAVGSCDPNRATGARYPLG